MTRHSFWTVRKTSRRQRRVATLRTTCTILPSVIDVFWLIWPKRRTCAPDRFQECSLQTLPRNTIMTWYADFSPCDYFGERAAVSLRAVGWLEGAKPYPR